MTSSGDDLDGIVLFQGDRQACEQNIPTLTSSARPVQRRQVALVQLQIA